MTHPYLSLKNINKSFTSSQETSSILQDINLDVGVSETIAIKGSSGCGKTTLMKIMAGLETPDNGLVTYTSMACEDWNEDDWAKFRADSVGFVFQDFKLIESMTVLENVEFSLTLRGYFNALDLAQHWLNSVGMAHRYNSYPHMLSGGEKQRVAIARAFAPEPAIILADEPTGSVDERNRDQILMLMHKMIHDIQPAMVIVTHDHVVASLAKKQYTLYNGSLGVCE